MNHTRHLVTTAEALQRVFFPQNAVMYSIAPQRQIQPIRRYSSTPQNRQNVAFVAGGSRSLKPPRAFGPRDTGEPPRNEHIRSFQIQLVDEDGHLKPPQITSQVLAGLDKKKYFLQQVSAVDSPEHDFPICKIFDKEAARKAEQARRKAQLKNAVKNTVKQLELSWVIDNNDLEHRLNKMVGFLEEGRKVEILLANKKRKRKATIDEAQGVIEKIRGKVKSLDGAKEWKAMEGQVGGLATLFIEGKLKKAVGGGEEQEMVGEGAAG